MLLFQGPFREEPRASHQWIEKANGIENTNEDKPILKPSSLQEFRIGFYVNG